MSDNHLNQIVKTIQTAETILVATHVFPDGDALGSQLGLGDILEGMGKKVIRYSEEPVSHLYSFLPGCEKLTTHLPNLATVDCVIVLDCGDCFRLGSSVERMLTVHPLIVIDHHAGHKEFGDLRWVQSGRASTGDMVYELAQALGAEISLDAAFCLYTAIVSDTGSFKYASTTPQTFAVAGELVAKGINPEHVAGKLFDNFTENRLHLLQAVLSTLELHSEGKLAIITATKAMFESTGAVSEDTESFINYPRSLASVKVAVFLKEKADVISVSMRSKGTLYDVAKIARRLGGGGHRNAAGCKFGNGETLQEARDRVVSLLLPLVQD
ncbi:MAG: bifunctional oligoribonuclease/PAP phosphatase NrnA [Proteobacteria bacterium]|nr:bifunctional oligoribonuclease/PAP phosphatase NrnA [Desulfobulbaceae bacterium]MBU4151907.1 bifunctional oligoribonuclease/PAP phosphatase NrnA [Pseudomonadota bacterium]MDP2107036.1 bifunctional oligoribonuclease/PAP phosphatase NrnA [Desulfobulbaceae bacterium]